MRSRGTVLIPYSRSQFVVLTLFHPEIWTYMGRHLPLGFPVDSPFLHYFRQHSVRLSPKVNPFFHIEVHRSVVKYGPSDLLTVRQLVVLYK